MEIIDCKVLAAKCIEDLKGKVENKGYSIAILYFEEESSTDVYMRNVKRVGAEIGVDVQEIIFNSTNTQEDMLNKIKELNDNVNIQGIFVSTDVPKHVNFDEVVMSINPKKDIDCATAHNIGEHFMGRGLVTPCTASSVIKILDMYFGEGFISGKNCVVIGRNNVVGKPIATSLLHKDGTITICHSRTKNLKELTKTADILVASVGKAKFVTSDMVSENTIVIDVGINYADGKLCGDVDFDNVKDIVKAITPVPGGVGAMTVSMFYENLYNLANN